MATVRWKRAREPASRAAWVLGAVAWLYVVWTLAPIATAVRASLDASGHPSSPSGFTLDAYRLAFSDVRFSHPYFLSLWLGFLTAAIATPLGAALAFGLDRWRGRGSNTLGVVAALAVVTPQVVLGTTFFYVFAFVYHWRLDSTAILLGHVTIAFPLVVVIVRSRLTSIGREIEEQAMDLGASPIEAILRVTLRLLAPALLVGAVVAFAVSFDNFVISHWLCLFNDCRTLPTLLYGGRSDLELDPIPLALGTAGLVTTAAVFSIGLLARRLLRGAPSARDRRAATAGIGVP